MEGDSIEDGIPVASSEGSKLSSRRKRFEKEDPTVTGGHGRWNGCYGDGLGNEERGGKGRLGADDTVHASEEEGTRLWRRVPIVRWMIDDTVCGTSRHLYHERVFSVSLMVKGALG